MLGLERALGQVHEGAGDEEGDKEEVERRRKGAPLLFQGREEVFQRRVVVGNLKQAKHAQYAKPAEICTGGEEGHQRRQDGG